MGVELKFLRITTSAYGRTGDKSRVQAACVQKSAIGRKPHAFI
jgi:hypothetical protein